MTDTIEIPGYVAGTWVIDTKHSHVGFVIKHMMVTKFRGQFSRVEGEITTAPDPLQSHISATVDVDSISTNDPPREDRIRSADFFDVANHPTMTFVSTGVRHENGNFYIDGDLTIRGTTKAVTFDADAPEFSTSPANTAKAGFSATTVVNRHDFGVSHGSPLPSGGFALSDKVQIVLEVEADLKVNS